MINILFCNDPNDNRELYKFPIMKIVIKISFRALTQKQIEIENGLNIKPIYFQRVTTHSLFQTFFYLKSGKHSPTMTM